MSNGVVPTDLGQVVKYRGGGDTKTNVVAEEIQKWWQYKYKCVGSTNTWVVTKQIQMWLQYKYSGGGDTNRKGFGNTNTEVVAVQIKDFSNENFAILCSSQLVRSS